MGMGRRSYLSPDSIGAGDPYTVSISDLMASLLTIFILALTYYMLSYSQARAQLVDNEDKRTEILYALRTELENNGIEVEVDFDQGVLRLPEGILFDKGKAELKDSGIRLISLLAPALKNILQQPDYANRVETIFVEGHTDSDPIRGGRFPSNWELSTQRAINTWTKLIQVEPELERLKNSLGQPLFSVSGYADRRPVQQGDTEEAKKRNRRIDLRFSMTPPRSNSSTNEIPDRRPRGW